jgi:hypothetical protein
MAELSISPLFDEENASQKQQTVQVSLNLA